MAYTTSGQLPVGTSYKLGNYTFNLAVNSTGVFATINDGENGAAKGASFRNPQIKSWSVEANENEASVYVQFANEPDTYPDYISVIQPPYKLNYKSYELIDLTGAEVQAFNADGTVWECDKYPNGIIPVSELTTTPINAEPSLSPYGIIDRQIKFRDYFADIKMAVCDYLYAYYRNYSGGHEWKSIEVHAEPGYDIIVYPYEEQNDYYILYIGIAKRVVGNEPIYDKDTIVGHIHSVGERKNGSGSSGRIEPFDETTQIYAYNVVRAGDLSCREVITDNPLYYHLYSFVMPITIFGQPIIECSVPFDKFDYQQLNPILDVSPYSIYLQYNPQKMLDITLSWSRPVDRKVLSATYEATIE